MQNTLESVLETIKQAGNYAVDVRYGEGIGADDCDIPINERNIKISATPAGVLGSARTLFIGTVAEMKLYDFSNIYYILVSNPPTEDEIKDYGYYIWGTESAIETLRDRLNITTLE